MKLDTANALGAIFTGVNRVEGLYKKYAQKHGVFYGVAKIIYVIKSNDSITQKQIAEAYGIPKQTVNSVVKQLEANNYISLIASDEDKREKRIQLTPLGETYAQEVLKHLIDFNETVVNSVGIDLINTLADGLNILGNALEMEIELREVSSKWEDKINSR